MINSIKSPAPAAAGAPAASGAARHDIAIADWDALYDAVTARLTHLAHQATLPGAAAQAAMDVPGDAPSDAPTHAPIRANGAAGAIGSGVLDCVQALRQLQAAVARELRRRAQQPPDADDLRAEKLARAPGLAAVDLNGRRSPPWRSDDVGGVADRLQFQARLSQVLTPGARPAGLLQALLLLGLDGHQSVDAVHGPGVAAQVLRVVGARLVRGLRQQDTVSGPWGDDYACLLVDVPGREQLSHLACKLFDIVAAPICVGTLQLSLHPTIGIAVSPGDADSTDGLLRCAEIARQNAWRHGSGYAFFDPAHNALTAQRQSA
jgi:GGDEF domain-containing protein